MCFVRKVTLDHLHHAIQKIHFLYIAVPLLIQSCAQISESTRQYRRTKFRNNNLESVSIIIDPPIISNTSVYSFGATNSPIIFCPTNFLQIIVTHDTLIIVVVEYEELNLTIWHKSLSYHSPYGFSSAKTQWL